jgi:hypothetical protein
MWIYEITVKQHVKRDDVWKSATFVERVQSMERAIFTVKRFEDMHTDAERDFRQVHSITIKPYWVMD